MTHFMSYIQSDVLLSTDSHPAAGLTYHLADVYVVELKEVCRGGAPSAAVLQALLEPFCQVLAKTNRAAFLPRLRYTCSLHFVNHLIPGSRVQFCRAAVCPAAHLTYA